MKKLYSLLLASCFGLFALHAQSLLENIYYNDLESRPCPYDESETVLWPVGWEVYQTTNGLWDGPVDSTRCITVEADGFNPTIDLGQIDPDLSLFIRSTDILNALLIPSHIYLSASDVQPNTGSILKLGTGCPGGLCSGLITRINIPAEIPGERSHRTYKAGIDGDNVDFYAESCIATERFEDQFLETFVIKFTFDEEDLSGQVLRLFFSDFVGIYDEVSLFPELVFPDLSFDGDSYDAAIEEVVDGEPWAPNYLGVYADTTYPSVDQPSFIEAQPETNTTTPQELNLYAGEYSNLRFQPFTQVRGALVEGSDSVRHELNIINEGMDWCLGVIIDLVFDGSTNLIYGGGHLDFGGETACLMFLNGSKLEVQPGVDLHYGADGDGLLGLGKEGQIVLGKDSRLFINNRVVLWNHEVSPDNQTYIDLQPGNHLEFGPLSRLERVGVQETGILLNVYMNGGTLDDSGLSPEDRLLINRIYPDVAPRLLDNISIFPNPVGAELQWAYVADIAGTVQWSCHNALGKVVREGAASVSRGRNIFTAPLEVPSGVYYLTIEAAGKRGTLPFVKAP
ncbi:T9SS type A sorting domain-containing protein [Phaeodactylibacter xiamenensis]|uniref:T9SS type A sorting domain-containing protein n=2 Tax=Phaeodactylibacter xiamenensis TaxID=1524460 RepID=UPI0024A8A582|nr:T9SS type A sorting domain-containing protein [Phaeodactylibacter xiamenensis]